MSYVVVYVLNGIKYFVQKHQGLHRLNGLIDNAIEYPDEIEAVKAIPRLEDILGKKLHPMEIESKL